MADDLWGDLPRAKTLRTPHAILLEQAQVLSKKTDGLLTGRVIRGTVPGGRFAATLQILANALKYTHSVVTVTYGVTLYPALISPAGAQANIEVVNEKQLVAGLRSVLSSDDVRRVIAALLAQIRSEETDDTDD